MSRKIAWASPLRREGKVLAEKEALKNHAPLIKEILIIDAGDPEERVVAIAIPTTNGGDGVFRNTPYGEQLKAAETQDRQKLAQQHKAESMTDDDKLDEALAVLCSTPVGGDTT